MCLTDKVACLIKYCIPVTSSSGINTELTLSDTKINTVKELAWRNIFQSMCMRTALRVRIARRNPARTSTP